MVNTGSGSIVKTNGHCGQDEKEVMGSTPANSRFRGVRSTRSVWIWYKGSDRGKSPNTYEVYHTQNEPTGEVTEWSHGRPGTVLVAFLLSSDMALCSFLA